MNQAELCPSRRALQPQHQEAATVRRLHLRAAIAAIALLAAGAPALATDNQAGGKPVAGGTLTFGLASDTAIIDPSITGSSITALITRNLVDSLVGQAEDNSFTPWLAERWEVNADNTIYTFHLRRGVTFSDGTPLDAAAVKFNFERILDPKTTSSYAKSLLGPVAGIAAPDAATVVISYKQAFAPLLQGLSLPYLGIQSPTYLREAKSTTNTVVGSGPFLLESFTKGSGSRLTRRADYNWGPGYAAHQARPISMPSCSATCRNPRFASARSAADRCRRSTRCRRRISAPFRATAAFRW